MIESKILGPDGEPMKRPSRAEVATPTMTGVRSIWQEPVASGLTPQRLARVLRQSTEPGADISEYLTLAEEIEEREPHYRSMMNTRKLALRGLPAIVEAATDEKADIDIADAVRTVVASTTYRRAIFHLADGIGKGFSAVEILWQTGADFWTPAELKHCDPRFFQFDRLTGRQLRLREDGNPEGRVLPPNKFIIHVPALKSGLPIRNGLARVAMWAFMLKSFSLKDWMAFLDVYGIPWRVGKWGAGASDNDKRALLRAVSQIASDGAAIIPESMVIELLETKSGKATDAFEKNCRYLDQQISKLVLGQTMTSEDGSSLAQAEIHNEVRLDILGADADELAASLQNDLVEPFVRFNFGVPKNGFPKLSIPVVKPADLKALMATTGSFVDRGGRVAEAEVRDKLGWRDPAPEDRLLMPLRRGTPQPAQDGEQASEERRLEGSLNRERCRACGGFHPVLNAEEVTEDLRLFDRAAAEAMDDWEEVIDPVTEPLLQLARDVKSFDEFIARLPDALSKMDSSQLVDRLRKATAVAFGLGSIVEP